MIADHQECPHCGGAIPREHFAHEDQPGTGTAITLLYCAHCGWGVETLWRVTGQSHAEDFSLEFRRDRDPVALGQFLQRLHDRRAA